MLGANKDVGVHQWFTGSVFHIRFSYLKSENKFKIHSVHTHTMLLYVILSILSIVFDRSIELNRTKLRPEWGIHFKKKKIKKWFEQFSHLRENIKVFETQIVSNETFNIYRSYPSWNGFRSQEFNANIDQSHCVFTQCQAINSSFIREWNCRQN